MMKNLFYDLFGSVLLISFLRQQKTFERTHIYVKNFSCNCRFPSIGETIHVSVVAKYISRTAIWKVRIQNLIHEIRMISGSVEIDQRVNRQTWS